jgi:hypothetical protein
MKLTLAAAVAFVLSAGPLTAQETKPVPKDSVRITVPGCTKGYIFTAGARTTEAPGSGDIPEGMRLRLNAPRKTMAEIKAHEGSMIEITGLMKKGQYAPGGINLGGGVHVGPGSTPGSGGLSGGSPGGGQVLIDLESWRPVAGNCPTR